MNQETGSVLMETVIAMPLLIALVFGALQLAHIHVARQVVGYAAYAAVRAALPAENSKEEESARQAAQRILCWLTASADSFHDGVLMPDPDSRSVKDRILEFKVNRQGWNREVELKFAFPLVMPLAAQIIAYQFNPTDFSKGQTGNHISTRKFGDSFTGPHLIFHERAALPKPYQVKE